MRNALLLLALLISTLFFVATIEKLPSIPRAEAPRPLHRPRAHSDRDVRQLIHRWVPAEQPSSQRQPLINKPAQLVDQRQPAGLRGRVLDAQGQPVSDVGISLYWYKDSKRRGIATTGATGHFEVQTIQPGEVIASAESNGRLGQTRVQLLAGQISEVTLVLEELKFYTLSGRVVDQTGVGVGYVTVQAFSERSPPSDLDRLLAERLQTMQTGDKGQFHLAVAARDWYRIEIREEPGGPVLLETRLFPDEAEELPLLVIPRAKVVTCQLRDSNGRSLNLRIYHMSYTNKRGGGGGHGGSLGARQVKFLWMPSWDHVEIMLLGEQQEASITLTGPEQPCLLTATPSRAP